MFRTIKNIENSVFGTKIVPTTSELNLTGSIYYGSAVTIVTNSYTISALFSASKNIDISKMVLWGDQNIAILSLKAGLLSVCFTEKRYRSINIG